jgi:hypothetical protein
MSSRTADVSGDTGHPGVSVDPSLEERLTREIRQSERTRMLILAGLSGSLVVVFPVLVLVFGPNYARIFGTAWAVQVFAVLVLLASYELAIRKIVGRRLEQGRNFSPSAPAKLRPVSRRVSRSAGPIHARQLTTRPVGKARFPHWWQREQWPRCSCSSPAR